MKNLTIFVDMDGTIEQLLDVWLLRLNSKYGYSVEPDDITDWDVSKFYCGLTRKQVFEVLDDDSIWNEIQPIEHSAEILQYFKNAGHRLYIATATSYNSVKPKMENLLFRCFPFLTWDDVIIINNKQLLKGDVMIDDGIQNLIGGEYRRLLFDAPYNRNIDDKELGIVRVHDWFEIKKIIDDMV